MNIPIRDRKDEVLEAVVQTHVRTTLPVSSRRVAAGLHVSSATIRNVFAELEKQGTLTHPHTSAGRIPTDQGYRFYVDRLLKVRQLTLREKQTVEQEYERGRAEIETLLRHTARVLSALTRLAGVALYNAPGELTLKYFKLVPISSRRVIVLLILGDVWVEEEMVHLEEPLAPRELYHITHLLNRRFAGQTLPRIREELLGDLERARVSRVGILQTVVTLLDGALGIRPEHLFVEGASRLAEQPEFRDPGALDGILRGLDRKEDLLHTLQQRWGNPGLRIDIGTEMKRGCLKECSFVHVPFHLWGRTVGALGVLGPVRMPYDRVVGLVEHVSGVLEKHLTSGGN